MGQLPLCHVANEFWKELVFYIDLSALFVYNTCMKKMLDETMKKFSIRLPIPLLERITEVAKKSRRSANAQIIYALEQYLEAVKETEQK